MKKRFTLLLALVMLLGCLTACGNENADNTGTPGAEASNGAGPAKTSVSVGSTAAQFVGHFDPTMLFSTETSAPATYLCYDQLFSIGTDGEWYSDILESWQWEGLNLILKLKDNIYFSNGDKMTASDVLYSIRRFAQSPRGGANFGFTDLENSYVSDDGLTVNLVYTATYGPYLSALNVFIVNESFIEDDMGGDDNIDWYSADSICGSGPYTVSDFQIGQSTTFEKRADWWQQEEVGDTAATVQTIKCQQYSDNNTMMVDYESGVLDVVISLTDDDCERIGADSALGTYVTVPSNAVAGIVLAADNEVFSNNEKLREAICIGVDTAAIAKRAWGILGSEATSSLSSSQPYYKGGHAYTYDADRAKQLIAETGLSASDLTFTLVGSSAGTSPTIAESFQYYMEQIGVTVQVEMYDQATAVSYWQQAGGTDFMITANAIPTVTNEAADVYTFYSSTFPYPSTSQKDDHFNELLSSGRTTADPEKRAEIYGEVQDFLYDNCIMIPLCQWSTAYAYNTSVQSCGIAVTASPNLRYIIMN